MVDKVRLGIIGCGGIAVSHLKGIIRNPDITLEAFCDVNVELETKHILNLIAVGDETRLVTRHCSKDRQFAPNSTLVPPLMFSDVTIRD